MSHEALEHVLKLVEGTVQFACLRIHFSEFEFCGVHHNDIKLPTANKISRLHTTGEGAKLLKTISNYSQWIGLRH